MLIRIHLAMIAEVASIAVMVVATAGCASRRSVETLRANDIDQAPPLTGEIIGHSVNGRSIECITLGKGTVTVLLLASIHGSEPAGTPLLNELVNQLQRWPDFLRNRRVMVIPNANPDGLATKRRHNEHGVDLNRNFPSANWRDRRRHGSSPSSEPESAAIRALIETKKLDRIISIHQPLGCIDYDGPAESLANAMAAIGGLPVKKLGSMPGSLGSFAGVDLGIPVITVELPGADTRLDDAALWRKWGPMMLEAIRHD